MNEGKKDRRDPIRTIKPRNFVAKNASATTSGAGAHKDKKKAMKQGDTKHKKQEYAESLQHMLESALRDKEDLQAKRKALQDIQMDPHTHKDPELKAELARRKANLEKEAKSRGIAESKDHSDHEAKMAKGELLQIAKNAMSIYQMIQEGDNLDGWVASYITVANDHLNSVQEQMEGDTVQGISEAEGDAEGLPKLTVDLAKHIRDQIGTEGPHAICKSVEWGDGAADDLVLLIQNALDKFIGEDNTTEATRTFAPPKTDLKVGDRVVADLRKEKNYPTDQKYVSGFVTRVGEKGAHIEPDGGGEPEWHPYKIVKKLGEGWTHDSLAAQLFESENTYEQQLAGKLARELKK